MSDAPDEILLHGRFEVDPVDLLAFRRIIEETTIDARAMVGCRHYCFSQDLDNETLFYLVERWRDQRSLDARLSCPRFLATQGQVARLKLISASMDAYDVRSRTT